jgi:hypothetical protein
MVEHELPKHTRPREKCALTRADGAKFRTVAPGMRQEFCTLLKQPESAVGPHGTDTDGSDSLPQLPDIQTVVSVGDEV